MPLPPMSGLSCLVHSVGRDGQIFYTAPSDDYTCQAAFFVKGYGRIPTNLRDGAVIEVKRPGDAAEGSVVSLTTLQAPPEAVAAWEKGMKALDNKKWTYAEKDLRRAVTIYPQYASAWSALGEALAQLSRPVEARNAWERAMQADPNYVKPYVLLARLAIREGRPEDAVNITGRALQTRYTQSLAVYFYHGVANLALGRLELAEQSARKAVELDPAHLLPKTEHLLDAVLAATGDPKGAVEHLKKYLEISPKAEDTRQVKQRISVLERRTTTDLPF